MMRALSLWQPWASLIAIGAKRWETRSWSTDYRGEVAIHAAKTWNGELADLCTSEPFAPLLLGHGLIRLANDGSVSRTWFPFGRIVAVATLTDVVDAQAAWTLMGAGKVQAGTYERSFGDYGPGRYAWRLENVRRLPSPISCTGRQGLWYVADDLEASVRAAIGEMPPCAY